jgi:hypothetical protein
MKFLGSCGYSTREDLQRGQRTALRDGVSHFAKQASARITIAGETLMWIPALGEESRSNLWIRRSSSAIEGISSTARNCRNAAASDGLSKVAMVTGRLSKVFMILTRSWCIFSRRNSAVDQSCPCQPVRKVQRQRRGALHVSSGDSHADLGRITARGGIRKLGTPFRIFQRHGRTFHWSAPSEEAGLSPGAWGLSRPVSLGVFVFRNDEDFPDVLPGLVIRRVSEELRPFFADRIHLGNSQDPVELRL